MAPYASCKALVIGIGQYADPKHDLSYARSDAEAMAELLADRFSFDQIWTLYDNDATRQNIIHFFENELQQTEEDDGLLIFFAGHGITVSSTIGDDRGFLIPHDGNPERPYANLSLTAIRDDYLSMMPAKHVFLIVDACYSGLAMRDIAARQTPETLDERARRRSRPSLKRPLPILRRRSVLMGILFRSSNSPACRADSRARFLRARNVERWGQLSCPISG